MAFSQLLNSLPIKQVGCVIYYDDSTDGFRPDPFSLWFKAPAPKGPDPEMHSPPLAPAMNNISLQQAVVMNQGKGKR